uniref:Senescence domain-containing protein n=1 Tax=Chromera velia CCMP2878 TaxID=1169474 RepID=A0A0G4HWQ5_9ALVE|eukprot:Cvel_9088.t1-p1 / transcript=Cvel_9088.t1 / gene=Cvel_9088 / organism=Chromera_velia_CCMP2878 / gene_product=hypothetical protein / transcript_product=hypothetical protein / location=Cvel_scaffold516:5644-7999(-) / protein_length=520 / sequence_SO=supercontig / SO=protein_coding / is_pseudo=false
MSADSLVRRLDLRVDEFFGQVRSRVPFVGRVVDGYTPERVLRLLRSWRDDVVWALAEAEDWVKTNAPSLSEEQQERIVANAISVWISRTNTDPRVAFEKLQEELKKAYEDALLNPVHEIRATYEEYAGSGPLTRGWKVTQQAGVQIVGVGKLACGGAKSMVNNGAVAVVSVTKGTISMAGNGLKATANTALCTSKQVIEYIPKNKEQLMLRAGEGKVVVVKYGNFAADKFLDTAKIVSLKSPKFLKDTQTAKYILETPNSEIKAFITAYVKEGVVFYAGKFRDPMGTLKAFVAALQAFSQQHATRAYNALPTRADLQALPSTVRETVAATPAAVRQKFTTAYELACTQSTKVEAFVRSCIARVPFLAEYSDVELTQIKDYLLQQAAAGKDALKHPVATTKAVVSFAKRTGGEAFAKTTDAAATAAGKVAAAGEAVVSKVKEPARKTAKRAIQKAQKVSEKVKQYTPPYIKSAAETSVSKVKGILQAVAGEGTPDAVLDFGARVLMISWIMEAQLEGEKQE